MVNENENKFLFLLIAVHECINPEGCNQKELNIDYEQLVKRKYYFCKPTDKALLERKVYSEVKVDSAVSKIMLFDSSTPDSPGKAFLMGLDVWVSKEIPALKSLSENAEFDCSEIPVEE